MTINQTKEVLKQRVLQRLQCARGQCLSLNEFNSLGQLVVRALARERKVRIDNYQGQQFAVYNRFNKG